MTSLHAIRNTFKTITLTWQPPISNGVIYHHEVTYSNNEVTYSNNEVVRTYKSTTPTFTIAGLDPNTIYTFSVNAYIVTGIGTPQQVQSSTADIREYLYLQCGLFKLCAVLTYLFS